MTQTILYAYAILSADDAEDLDLPKPVPQGGAARAILAGRWAMIASDVPADHYSQAAIDEHANDLEWLGSVGMGHQRVNEALSETFDAIPLRAFTLFSDENAVRRWLEEHTGELDSVHKRTAGKLEWTLRFDFADSEWMETPALEALRKEIEQAPAGKAYLLRKKLERELDLSRQDMENQFVSGIADRIEGELHSESVIENRVARGGADPQIDLLCERECAGRIETLVDSIREELRARNVNVSLTGPWPPYTFAGRLS